MPRYKDSPEVRAAKQERREKLRELLALMEVEDVRDLKSVFKEMVGEVLENGLEAELDDKLGYTKYDYRNKDTDNSRNGHSVEWCACFVSWCANECGYIETGVIPKFAGCVNGVQWFKDRGQWIDGSAEPVPGMIIFFDWDNKGSSGPQDGLSDHVGIVQKVENGKVYTVEGNSGDSVRTREYVIGHYEILGYAIPAY